MSLEKAAARVARSADWYLRALDEGRDVVQARAALRVDIAAYRVEVAHALDEYAEAVK